MQARTFFRYNALLVKIKGEGRMADMNTIKEILLTGDGDKLKELVQSALDEGIDAADILNQGLISGMDIVGEKMKNGDMFIPEVLMSARAMGLAVEILKPLLGEGGASMGKVIIGTVKGDLHDIGKNLVAMMLGSAGLEVIDLGVDVPPEVFV
jgi:5-methyltetrahydrofolate--homocysteine methyltransferase